MRLGEVGGRILWSPRKPLFTFTYSLGQAASAGESGKVEIGKSGLRMLVLAQKAQQDLRSLQRMLPACILATTSGAQAINMATTNIRRNQSWRKPTQLLEEKNNPVPNRLLHASALGGRMMVLSDTTTAVSSSLSSPSLLSAAMEEPSVPTRLRMNSAWANTPFWLQNSELVEGEGRASLLSQIPEITGPLGRWSLCQAGIAAVSGAGWAGGRLEIAVSKSPDQGTCNTQAGA